MFEQRVSYEKGELDERSVSLDPFDQFTAWYEQARAHAEIVEPGAMALATATAEGVPSLRTVLLRGVDARGFAFFTNYESRKGRELNANPFAALLFFWDRLERQIRIEGGIERLDAAESDAYFALRPRGHRLNAWASAQSSVVPDRAFVDARLAAEARRFEDADVPRPPFWGGYRVVPAAFEFWQGRPDRSHDRIAYVREGGGWRTVRLSP
jgi:pyridoxamine 5'-phosphate oxidase